MVYGNCNCAHYIQKKFITLVWQVNNVLIEARSPIKAGSLNTSQGSKLDVLIEAGGWGFYQKFYSTSVSTYCLSSMASISIRSQGAVLKFMQSNIFAVELFISVVVMLYIVHTIHKRVLLFNLTLWVVCCQSCVQLTNRQSLKACVLLNILEATTYFFPEFPVSRHNFSCS